MEVRVEWAPDLLCVAAATSVEASIPSAGLARGVPSSCGVDPAQEAGQVEGPLPLRAPRFSGPRPAVPGTCRLAERR